VKIKRQECTQNARNKIETRAGTKTKERTDYQRTTETKNTPKIKTDRQTDRQTEREEEMYLSTRRACRYGSAQRCRPVSLHKKPQLFLESKARVN